MAHERPAEPTNATGAGPVSGNGTGGAEREFGAKEVTLALKEPIPSPGLPEDECTDEDQVFHLVQDDKTIANIHTEELPPDEY